MPGGTTDRATEYWQQPFLLGDIGTAKGERNMVSLGLPELIIIAIFVFVFIIPFWKIFAKAGFSGWLSLTQIVPILNIVMLFYVAFAEWPLHRELKRLREHATPIT
jgi:hypothetical protein